MEFSLIWRNSGWLKIKILILDWVWVGMIPEKIEADSNLFFKADYTSNRTPKLMRKLEKNHGPTNVR